MRLYCDTSVLVAGLVKRHPRHAAAEALFQRVRRGEDRAFLATHGLAETYSVLTSFTNPRISPAEAIRGLWMLCEIGFKPVMLTPANYFETLESLAIAGFAGGITYDALHLAAARLATPDYIHTCNVADFQRLAPDLADRIKEP